MKIKKIRDTAFFNLRVLIASLLWLGAGILLLFAFEPLAQPDNNTQTSRSSDWLTRVTSTLGLMSTSQPGGAIKLDKNPADATQALLPAAVPYKGAPQSLRPVTAVRSAKLRDIRPINPAS